jgi:hypothetical protein
MGNSYRLARLGLGHLEGDPELLHEVLRVMSLITEIPNEKSYNESRDWHMARGQVFPTWEEHMKERDEAIKNHPKYAKQVADKHTAFAEKIKQKDKKNK